MNKPYITRDRVASIVAGILLAASWFVLYAAVTVAAMTLMGK